MLRVTTFGGLRIDGRSAPASEVRPRRLALLAILAAAGVKGASRDQLLGILWAESEPERARHSLSQALYSLRGDLGVDVVLVSSTLQLDAAKITSDVDDFRAAVADKDWDRAATLYAGPFLDGFYLSDAPQFERWADEERSALSHEAHRALENAARQATADGREDVATDHWRRLTKFDPISGRFAIGYMEVLAGAGDRAGALLHGQSHADLVRRELDIEPDGEVLRVMERLRDGAVATPRTKFVPYAPPVSLEATTGTHPAVARAALIADRSRRRSRTLWAGAAAIVFGAAISAPLWRKAIARDENDAARTSVRTRSPIADRLYQEGLRAFFAFDAADASRLFGAAVKEDPRFALATYFAWRSEVATNGPGQETLAKRALALASHAPERDRLLIVARVGLWDRDMNAIPIAESLAHRFPNDPEGLVVASEVTSQLPGAVALLNRAIALDSAASAEPSPPAGCRACEAFNVLVQRYVWADSVATVQQTLDRWSALRPGDYTPWQIRADYLVGLGRNGDADAALRRADSLGASPPHDSGEWMLARSLRSDDFEAANDICRNRLGTADADEFARYRWWCTIALRMQGRYRDALNLVRGGRIPWSNVVRHSGPPDRVNEAILDMEMGRPLAAAMQYSQLAAEATHSSLSQGQVARTVAWELTLSATASAVAGDTIRVRALVDSVELTGHRSLYGRDPLLHHFLRGVLLADAGQHEAAVREFHAAISSPSQGYTRINYEMGKSLLALHRPAEAIPIVRAPLHGGLDGSGLYLTRTETHELLARAFDAAGQRDSAATHYAIVERAWRAADPSLASRHEAARQWLLRAGRAVR